MSSSAGGAPALRPRSAAGNTGSGDATFRGGWIKNDIGVFIRALDEVTDVSLLSNPKVLALNRQRARVLVGTHDFAAFAAAGHGRESTVRTVHGCRVVRTGADRLHIDISADGFLWNMVRIVAGTLMEVGMGRKSPADVARALESRDRRLAGNTLGPEGLCLMWARYPDDPPAPEPPHSTV